MRLAALDLGSNSFHLIVAEVTANGRYRVLDRAKEMVRLGQSTLRNGLIPPDGFRRGLEALRFLKVMADRYQPDALLAVATSAVREAENGGEFVRAARDELGIDVRVIGGKEEARLIYLGARTGLALGQRRVALFDLGGGSLEVILGDAAECYFADSLKLGGIRLQEEWAPSDPPTAHDMESLRQRVRNALEPTVARLKAMGFDFVALSSGTAFALAGLARRKQASGGRAPRTNGRAAPPDAPKTLGLADLSAVEAQLASLRVKDRAKLDGLDSRRAETALPGAVVLGAVLDLCGVREATLCDAALREGLIADYIAQNRPGIHLVDEFPDRRRRSVMELARRCHYHETHAHQVARLSLSLFHQTQDLHQLSSNDGQLLEFAALLHDIGFYISPKGHHRHTEYLINSHDFRGFSRDEVKIMALVARFHRKATPKKNVRELARLSKETRRKVCLLSALLRLGDSLDRTHACLVRAVRCTVLGNALELRLEVEDDPELELWAARRKGDLFEELTGKKIRFALDWAGALGHTREPRA